VLSDKGLETCLRRHNVLLLRTIEHYVVHESRLTDIAGNCDEDWMFVKLVEFLERPWIDECTANLIVDFNDKPNVAGVGANVGSRIMTKAISHPDYASGAKLSGELNDLQLLRLQLLSTSRYGPVYTQINLGIA
jgi:hypothetical protein